MDETLTLDETIADYFTCPNAPSYARAMFGRVSEKLTVPFEVSAQIGAERSQI